MVVLLLGTCTYSWTMYEGLPEESRTLSPFHDPHPFDCPYHDRITLQGLPSGAPLFSSKAEGLPACYFSMPGHVESLHLDRVQSM